jgi:hypothetical protein
MIEALGTQTVVPGHGPVGRSKDLSVMTQYIQSLESIVANMAKSGRSIEEVSLQPIPSQFEDWLLLFDNFFADNLQFLYKCLKQRKEKK